MDSGFGDDNWNQCTNLGNLEIQLRRLSLRL